MKRFFPHKEFPPYAFVPGEHPHPEKPGGHMYDTEISSPALTDHKENMAYLYGIDLYNHGYYWESHVWWEYLWHLAGRKGETADFLKGLIKLAAGNLKKKMGDETSHLAHKKRAHELFSALALKTTELHGIDLKKMMENSNIIELKI